MPLVSVIIPAYNAAKFIRETLTSVQQQIWPSIEVFVIDDGSVDDTVAIARSFQNDHFSVVEQKNSGACVARNRGLDLSKGKYIQFLDADDVISPEKIQRQVEVLEENPGYLGVCSTVHFLNGDNYLQMKPREESFWIYDTDDPVDFLVRLYGGDGKRWMVQTSAWLTPKTITDRIGAWNESLLLDQDGEYFARAVLASNGIRTTPGINYYRRFTWGNNISAKSGKKENLESALLALNLKAQYLSQYTHSDRYMQAFATLYVEIAINAYPQFPELVTRCEEEIQKTGKMPDLPVLGGKLIELIKYFLGWKTAKLVRKRIHSLINR